MKRGKLIRIIAPAIIVLIITVTVISGGIIIAKEVRQHGIKNIIEEIWVEIED